MVARDGEEVRTRQPSGLKEFGPLVYIVGRIDAMVWRATQRGQVIRTDDGESPAVAVLKDAADSPQLTRSGHGAQVFVECNFGVGPSLDMRGRIEKFVEASGSAIRDDDGVAREAVCAVQVAAEHAEGERVGAGEDVEEGLLLGRVALEGGDVVCGNQQATALVEAHLADAALAFVNQTAVAARVAAQTAAPEALGQLLRALCRHLVQNFSQTCRTLAQRHLETSPVGGILCVELYS